MKKMVVLLLALLAVSVPAMSGIIRFTGIVDAVVDGNAVRVIELYVEGSDNFQGINLHRSVDGASFSSLGSIYTWSGGKTFTDEFVYLVTDSTMETRVKNVFGLEGKSFVRRSSMTADGNDAFRFIWTASPITVMDQVWFGTSTNGYQNSYMYRKNGTGPNYGPWASNDADCNYWTPNDWMNVGNNGSLQGLTAAQIKAAVPLGTYQVPEPATLVILGLGGLALLRRK